jgi:hypothetical protein
LANFPKHGFGLLSQVEKMGMTRMKISIGSIALLLVAGCGGGQEASVTGVATLDGNPLGGASVVFNPVDRGPIAYANTDANGKFAAQTGQQSGLPPGKYDVTVRATKMPDFDPNSNEEPEPILISPKIYESIQTTPFKNVEITAGSNVVSLDLVSK